MTDTPSFLDAKTPFYIASGKGPHSFRFWIPGGFDFHWKRFCTHIYKSMLSRDDASRVDPDIAREFVKDLSKRTCCHTRLTGKQVTQMSEGNIPAGFQVTYKMPLFCGGLCQESNLMLAEEKIVPWLNQHLWKPLARKIQTCTDDSAKVDLPHLPSVMTQNILQIWWLDNQQSLQKHIKKTQSAKRHVQILTEHDPIGIIFSANNHPFLGYQTRLIEVTPIDANAKKDFQEDMFLQREVVRKTADSYWLPHLTTRQMKEARLTGILPEHSGLNIHHIMPISLGGKNELSNLVLLDRSTHNLLHTYLLNGLSAAIWQEQKRQFNLPVEKRQRLFVRIPVLPPAGKKLAHRQQRFFDLEEQEIDQLTAKTPEEKNLHKVQKKSRSIQWAIDADGADLLPAFERISKNHRLPKYRIGSGREKS